MLSTDIQQALAEWWRMPIDLIGRIDHYARLELREEPITFHNLQARVIAEFSDKEGVDLVPDFVQALLEHITEEPEVEEYLYIGS